MVVKTVPLIEKWVALHLILRHFICLQIKTPLLLIDFQLIKCIGLGIAGCSDEDGRDLLFKELDRINLTSARKKGSIGFAVTRGGEIAGEHTVSFIGKDDKIDLIHKAHNRSIFVKGAIEAAVFLSKQKKGLYFIKDVIEF